MELVSIKVSWTPVQKRGAEFAIDNGSELCDSSGGWRVNGQGKTLWMYDTIISERMIG